MPALGLALAGALLVSVTLVEAAPPLPQRNLSVEVRMAQQTQSEREAAAGSLVISSRAGTSVQGGVTVRSGSDTTASQQVQHVLVLNGGRATVRLSQLTPLSTVSLAWSGQTTGLAERTLWVDVGSGMVVRPSWPGGAAPVRVEVEIESAAGAGTGQSRDAGPGMARSRVQTELSLPLGAWVTVAELSEASSGSTSVGGFSASTQNARGSRSLQMRITVP